MLNFDFVFVPFDLTPLYESTVQQYRWGWFGKDYLKSQVDAGLLPAKYYEEATGEKYEKADKKTSTTAN